jgi:hypothetical protein
LVSLPSGTTTETIVSALVAAGSAVQVVWIV